MFLDAMESLLIWQSTSKESFVMLNWNVKWSSGRWIWLSQRVVSECYCLLYFLDVLWGVQKCVCRSFAHPHRREAIVVLEDVACACHCAIWHNMTSWYLFAVENEETDGNICIPSNSIAWRYYDNRASIEISIPYFFGSVWCVNTLTLFLYVLVLHTSTQRDYFHYRTEFHRHEHGRKFFLLSNDIHVIKKNGINRDRVFHSGSRKLIEYFIVDTSCQQSSWWLRWDTCNDVQIWRDTFGGAKLLRYSNLPGGTDRLPSSTRINSSVCLSVRTCLQIMYSAENGTGPTDLVNYSLKSRIHVNRESEILFLRPTRSECFCACRNVAPNACFQLKIHVLPCRHFHASTNFGLGLSLHWVASQINVHSRIELRKHNHIFTSTLRNKLFKFH